jgi:hypothetical protein
VCKGRGIRRSIWSRTLASFHLSKLFYDTFTDTATKAAHYGSLLEGLRSLELVAMDEHGGHDDLRGLDRQSVTPYIHREYYCIVVCMTLFKAELNLFYPVTCPTFYNSRHWQLRCDPGPNRWP